MSVAIKTVYDDAQFVVLFVKPNWNSAPQVEESCPTSIETTRLGVEYRRPDRGAAIVSKISYVAHISDTDWQFWRGIQTFIGDCRVVCPIWPDVLRAAGWASRVHQSDIVLAWNAGFVNPILRATTDDLAGRTYYAPVCIGRLKVNDDKPVTGADADIKVEVTADMSMSVAYVAPTTHMTLTIEGQVTDNRDRAVTLYGAAACVSGSAAVGSSALRVSTSVSSRSDYALVTPLAADDFVMAGDFSFSIWVNPTSLNSSIRASIASVNASGLGHWTIHIFSSYGMRCWIETPSGWQNAGNAPAWTGSWKQVTLARAAGTIRLYVDGVDTGNQLYYTGNMGISGAALSLGRGYPGDNYSLCGLLDDAILITP